MRTVVITGANAGLGYRTAVAVARTGARVVMACRSPERAARAERELVAEVPGAAVVVLPLDVAEPASIRDFGILFGERVGELDVLINNAGITRIPLERNARGHELQLATNYLGAFAVTGTLMPYIRPDAPGRIVNVGSLAHRVSRLDLDDINWERTPYDRWRSYARSKLAMQIFTMELSRRLQDRGSPVIALGAHPGLAATGIGGYRAALDRSRWLGRWARKTGEWLLPVEQAARPIVHAACSEEAASGDYYGPAGFLEIRGGPGRARVHPAARDAGLGGRLWALSESMTGVRFLSEAAAKAPPRARAAARSAG
jgi:NAD(P)-dependent dehydrogenase (short-subunit alcohol dehydrogenase family)